jgi:hypothetical protein
MGDTRSAQSRFDRSYNNLRLCLIQINGRARSIAAQVKKMHERITGA